MRLGIIGKRQVDDYKKKGLKAIVEQLEFCGYECEGGILINNVAFIALKEIAEEVEELKEIKNYSDKYNDFIETIEEAQTDYDTKEIAYMKQVRELEKEVGRLEKVEESLYKLLESYRSDRF